MKNENIYIFINQNLQNLPFSLVRNSSLYIIKLTISSFNELFNDNVLYICNII